MAINPIQTSEHMPLHASLSLIVSVDELSEKRAKASKKKKKPAARSWSSEYVVTWEMLKNSPLDSSGWPMDM